MEHKQTAVTPRDLEDADPLQFQHLVEKVWGIFEQQVCEEAAATKMLRTAAETISSIGNYRKIEDDFKLGLLGEYVGRNDETLPFLATVMSHIHNQLETELQTTPSTPGHPPRCAMTTFLKELESKLGADDRTINVVQEIAEMANLASSNLAEGNPEFSRLLMEIGDTMRVSWESLRDEVEKCIRHARKKNLPEKHMRHIYKRIICKGLSSAKNIQEKIGSVTAALESQPAIAAVAVQKSGNPSPKASAAEGLRTDQSSHVTQKKDAEGKGLSPSTLMNTSQQISAKQKGAKGAPGMIPSSQSYVDRKPSQSTSSKGETSGILKKTSQSSLKSQRLLNNANEDTSRANEFPSSNLESASRKISQTQNAARRGSGMNSPTQSYVSQKPSQSTSSKGETNGILKGSSPSSFKEKQKVPKIANVDTDGVKEFPSSYSESASRKISQTQNAGKGGSGMNSPTQSYVSQTLSQSASSKGETNGILKGSSPSSLKEKPKVPKIANEDTDGVKEFTSSSLVEKSDSNINQTGNAKKGVEPASSSSSKPPSVPSERKMNSEGTRSKTKLASSAQKEKSSNLVGSSSSKSTTGSKKEGRPKDGKTGRRGQ